MFINPRPPSARAAKAPAVGYTAVVDPPAKNPGSAPALYRDDALSTQTDAFNYMSYHFLCKRGIHPARTEQFLVFIIGPVSAGLRRRGEITVIPTVTRHDHCRVPMTLFLFLAPVSLSLYGFSPDVTCKYFEPIRRLRGSSAECVVVERGTGKSEA